MEDSNPAQGEFGQAPAVPGIPQEPKSRKVLLIILAGSVVLVIAGIVLALFFTRSNSEVSPNQQTNVQSIPRDLTPAEQEEFGTTSGVKIKEVETPSGTVKVLVPAPGTTTNAPTNENLPPKVLPKK